LSRVLKLTSPGEIGNGRATAILLARHGAKVALVDNNIEWVRETKAMIDEEGGISEVIQADVTDEESVKNAVTKTVQLFGAVHILVNIGEFGIALLPPETPLMILSRCWRCAWRRNRCGYESLGP
jgi:NAD(P)-dependent dehydrogenase (short-subunit alcohol dehydrogenase family)